MRGGRACIAFFRYVMARFRRYGEVCAVVAYTFTGIATGRQGEAAQRVGSESLCSCSDGLMCSGRFFSRFPHGVIWFLDGW